MKRLIPVEPELNAYRFSFEGSLLDELRAVYNSVLSDGLNSDTNAFLLEGGVAKALTITHPVYNFHLTSYGKAPLLWVSNNDAKTYALFKRFFDSLDISDDIKQLVDYKKDLVMYCGFFVVGNYLDQELWHVDYLDGANAYTLIAPLLELSSEHGNLLYADDTGRIKKYHYALNEAIVFGDGFRHSTEVYKKTSAIRVLVSMTFGTDKIKYWDILKNTINGQSEFMVLPCGHERGSCHCLSLYKTGK